MEARSRERRDFAKVRRTGIAAFAAVATLNLPGCGNAGKSTTAGCSLCGDMSDLTGIVLGNTGTQSQLQGWAVAAFEFDTGIARVGEIDANATYVLQQTRTAKPLTLALYSPQYLLQAVTSIPSPTDKTIRQFFYATSPTLPKLTSNGPVVTFETLDGITPHSEVASAQNDDGVPDGATKITGTATSALTDGPPAWIAPLKARMVAENPGDYAGLRGFGLDDGSTPPPDAHGMDPRLDPDIDGDGIINWLDYDDNGNKVFDVFDPDQNSDLVADMTPDGHNTDQWFTEGVESIGVKYEVIPTGTATAAAAYVTLSTKVRDGTQPASVEIRGATQLFDGAVTVDPKGNPAGTAWDRTLADDGANVGGAAGDGVYGRRLLLKQGVSPRSNETLFFKLVFGTSSPWAAEYPFTFPPLTMSAITANYDSTTRTVELAGNPFASVQDFVWIVNVFDSTTSTVIWSSAETQGTTRTLTIPDNVLTAGASYTYEVIAQTLDKVPTMPVMAIHTATSPLKP